MSRGGSAGVLRVAGLVGDVDTAALAAALAAAGQIGPKANVASVPPTASDNSSSGYGPGSVWLDTSTAILYVCTAASGSAVWLAVRVRRAPQRIAGRRYSIWPGGSTNTSAVPAAGTFYAQPFALEGPLTVSAFEGRVSLAGTSSWVRAGIWRDNGGLPDGTAVLAYNNTDKATTTASALFSVPLSGPLAAGQYWAIQEHGGTLPTCSGCAIGTDMTMAALIGRSSLTGTTGVAAFQMTNPGTGSGAWTTGQSPTFNAASDNWADCITSGVPVLWLAL